eukprot:TRINITY_DN5837_c0_g1_i2.p1 TRINITY_DN5837_c0_g1~~TRINITY_DN5837_c0_g1_i2.p1  ORF type:complete len:182 (-),score=45.27 TRINITY_DN5837_c0_g1_i2:259-804(-)
MSKTYNVYLETKALLQAGIVSKPSWFDALTLVPPPPKATRPGGKIPLIVYEEDKLRQKFFQRNPHMVAREVQLHRFDYSPSEEFVKQQMDLIKKGMNEKEAYRVVKEKFDADSTRMAYERVAAEKQALEFGAVPVMTDDEVDERLLTLRMRDAMVAAKRSNTERWRKVGCKSACPHRGSYF